MRRLLLLGLLLAFWACSEGDDQQQYVPTPVSLSIPQTFQDLLPPPTNP